VIPTINPITSGFIIAFILTVLTACSNIEAESIPQSTSLLVTASNVKGTKLIIKDSYDFEVGSAILQESQFQLPAVIESDGYYTLQIDSREIPVYLSEGSTLAIALEGLGSKLNVTFRGTDAESNKYMQAFQLFEETNKPEYDILLAKDEDDFLLETRRYRSKCEAFLSNYQSKNFNLDPIFISRERARILYSWANQLTYYPQAHRYFVDGDDFVLSDNYHDFKKTVNLDAADLLTLKEYQDFVNSYIQSEAEMLIAKGDKRDPIQVRFDIAGQHISETAVLDFAMYSILTEAMRHGMDEVTEALVSIFEFKCKNAVFLAHIKEMTQRWNSISAGKKAPELKLQDSSGHALDLHRFEGKYVFINFWASWCSPCLSDYDKLMKIADQTKRTDLIILSVCIDEDRTTWTQGLRSAKRDIIEAWLPDDLNSDKIKDQFVLNSLPRYMMIDREGRMVDPTAPAPGSLQFQKLLSQLSLTGA